MLDLDTLAEKRARALQENEEPWRAAVWSPVFQAIAQNMTDGEVEQLLVSCPSLPHFEAVLKLFDDSEKQARPFTVLEGEASKRGQNLAEFIQKLSL